MIAFNREWVEEQLKKDPEYFGRTKPSVYCIPLTSLATQTKSVVLSILVTSTSDAPTAVSPTIRSWA